MGKWFLALAPTLHLFVPLLPFPYDFTILADVFMSHPNIESVIGIEEHRIAIIDVPFTHPDFPALFETCSREPYTRVVLCTQCVGVSQAQGFRDEVTRIGSLAGRDMLLHGVVPSSVGDADNVFAPGEIITHLFCAVDEGQRGGGGAVQRLLKNVAEFVRESFVESPHCCTARSAVLAGAADCLAGLLTALPVMQPDIPMQWPAVPAQLHTVLKMIHDQSGGRDGMLEHEVYASVLPLAHVIQSWLTPLDLVVAALAHAIKRAMWCPGVAAWDPLLHSFTSKNLRECFANKLVVKVMAQDAAAAAAAAVAAVAAAPGPAFVSRSADRPLADHGGVYTALLNAHASRCPVAAPVPSICSHAIHVFVFSASDR
jgi:hypothetical protein